MRRPLSQFEERRKIKNRKWIRLRALSVLAFLALGYFALYVRSYALHLGHDPRLVKLAKQQYLKKIVLSPERGAIYDRNGHELALDVQVYSIFAHPLLIPNDERKRVAEGLAAALSGDKVEFLERLESGKHFVWIERRVGEEIHQAVLGKKLPGVFSVPEKKRYYPNGALAGQLLGAVGYDAEALGGIELAYDSHLKSKQESYLLEKDARGRSYLYVEGARRDDFADIHLSIDRTIQYLAERELALAVEKFRPNHAFIIVTKPATGEILAVANAPQFDPNHYADFPIETWRNHAFLDVFEPGSTFKAVSAAAALHTGQITSDSAFFCENGNWRVGNRVIHDHHGHGTLSLGEIIKVSSNIGTAKVVQAIGRQSFISMISELGFGRRSFLKFPGESAGMLQNEKSMGPVEEANMAFGQGIAVTGLQMVQAYGAFAGGGTLMQPLLVKSIVNQDREAVLTAEPKAVRQVLTPSESKVLSDMLHGVVEPGGTATTAALPNFKVSGKTGTAQKVVDSVYAAGKYVSSFIGYVPTDRPELLIYAVLDEPKPQYYGGVVAAPLFRRIADQALNHLGVMGDVELAGESIDFQVEGAMTEGNPRGTRAPTVAPAEKDAPHAQGQKEIAQSLEQGVVPDLIGLSLREILPPFNRFPYSIESRGVGFVVEQSPRPGTELEPGTAIQVVLAPNDRG